MKDGCAFWAFAGAALPGPVPPPPPPHPADGDGDPLSPDGNGNGAPPVGLADEFGAGLGEEHVADGDGEGIESGLDCVDDGLGLGWGLAEVAPASNPTPTATAERMAIAVNSRLMLFTSVAGRRGSSTKPIPDRGER